MRILFLFLLSACAAIGASPTWDKVRVTGTFDARGALVLGVSGSGAPLGTGTGNALPATGGTATNPRINQTLFLSGSNVDSTATINAALVAGNLTLTSGTFLISDELKVPSYRVFRVLPGAYLKRSGTSIADGECSFIRNSDYVGGNTDITIEGGVYDGNADENSDVAGVGEYLGGVGFRFRNVTQLSVTDCTMQRIRFFAIQIGDVSNFSIRRIRLEDSSNWPSEDGVHVNGPASFGTIEDISTDGGSDDLVALNANDLEGGSLPCEMTQGEIHHINVNRVSSPFTDTPTGPCIRLLTGTFGVHDVTVSNVRGSFCRNQAIIMSDCASIGISSTPGTGTISNVLFQNFDVEIPYRYSSFVHWSGCGGENIAFQNIRVTLKAGATDPYVTGPGTYFFNHWTGFSHTQTGTIVNLSFSNVTLSNFGPDTDTPFNLLGAVNSLRINGITFNMASGTQDHFIDASLGAVPTIAITGGVLKDISFLATSSTGTALFVAGLEAPGQAVPDYDLNDFVGSSRLNRISLNGNTSFGGMAGIFVDPGDNTTYLMTPGPGVFVMRNAGVNQVLVSGTSFKFQVPVLGITWPMIESAPTTLSGFGIIDGLLVTGTGTASINPNGLLLGQMSETNIAVSGATLGDRVLIGPPANPPSFISWSGYVKATGTACIRISAIATVTGSAQTWNVSTSH